MKPEDIYEAQDIIHKCKKEIEDFIWINKLNTSPFNIEQVYNKLKEYVKNMQEYPTEEFDMHTCCGLMIINVFGEALEIEIL